MSAIQVHAIGQGSVPSGIGPAASNAHVHNSSPQRNGLAAGPGELVLRQVGPESQLARVQRLQGIHHGVAKGRRISSSPRGET